MMEQVYRGAVKDPAGRISPLEQCVPGLRGYVVRGIQWVSPQGWFVADAVKAKDQQEGGVRLAYGPELFWIEPETAGKRVRR